MRKVILTVFGVTAALSAGGAGAQPASSQRPLVFIGQDLGSIRGFHHSQCCGPVDGATAYISFYSLLSPEQNFGGLGVDAKLKPLKTEADWGAGPSSAWLAACEIQSANLAIGVSLTEDAAAGGLKKIAEGKFDPEIRHLAAFVRKVGRPVFLRVGYEFDGVWNKGYQDHSAYVAAWRRIVDVVRSEGAANAGFVWQTSASPIDDVLDGHHDAIENWYPGDAYVDWMGLSWFLSPDERGPAVAAGRVIPTQRELADELLNFARSRGKPVMIAELSPQGYDLEAGTVADISPIWDGVSGQGEQARTADQIWSDWFSPLFQYLRANKDAVRAIAYINTNWDKQAMWGPPYSSGYWGDTRLQANPAIAARWRAAIDDWRATEPGVVD